MQVQVPWSKVEFFLSVIFCSCVSFGFCGECSWLFVGCHLCFQLRDAIICKPCVRRHVCLLHYYLFFLATLDLDTKVPPPTWISALRLWQQWPFRTGCDIYPCSDALLFVGLVVAMGHFVPAVDGVLKCFLVHGSPLSAVFMDWVSCAVCFEHCCSSFLPVGCTWFIRAPSFFCGCFPWIWDDRPCFFVVRRIRKIAKRDYQLCRVYLSFRPSVRHVRLSPWNISGPNNRIFIKFDIWVFWKDQLRMFMFN